MENQRRLDESNKFGLYAIMNCDRKKLRLPPTIDPDVWGLSMKRAKPNVQDFQEDDDQDQFEEDESPLEKKLRTATERLGKAYKLKDKQAIAKYQQYVAKYSRELEEEPQIQELSQGFNQTPTQPKQVKQTKSHQHLPQHQHHQQQQQSS